MSAHTYMTAALRPSALEIVARLGLHLEPGDYLSCPFCASPHLRLTNDSFLCDGVDCPWLVGNGLDLVRAHLKLPDSERALQWLLTQFPDRYSHVPELDRKRWRGDLGKLFDRQRALVDLLLREGGPQAPRVLTIAHVESWLRNQGYAPDTNRLTAFRLSGESLDALKRLIVRLFPGQLPAGSWPDAAAVVIPFCTRPEWVSRLEIIWPRTNKRVAIQLDAQAVQYAGMWQARQNLRTVLVGDATRLLELLELANARRSDLRLLAAHAAYQYHHHASMPLAAPVWAYDVNTETPVLWQHVQNSQGTRIAFIPYETLIQMQPEMRPSWWTTAVLAYIEKHQEDGLLAAEAQTQLRALQLTVSERTQLRRELTNAGHLATLHLFDRLSAERIICRNNGTLIVERPEGYEITRDDSPPELLCNFTLEPLASVVFGQDSRLSYELRMRFGGSAYNVLLSRNALEIPAQVEAALQTRVLRSTAAARADQIPMILSKQQFPVLVRHWKEHLARMPVKQGIESLGWSSDRRKFWTPAGFYDIDGFHPLGNLQWHPEVAAFANFSHEGLAREVGTEVPAVLRDIWRVCVAGMVRVFQQRPHMATVFHQRPQDQQMLEQMFLALGQRQGLNNLQMQSTVFNGYPAYAFSHSWDMARFTEGSFLILAPSGFSCAPLDLDTIDLQRAGQRLLDDLGRVALWLLEQTGRVFPDGGVGDNRHVTLLSQTRGEGNWFLQRVFGEEAWPEPTLPFQHLEAWLSTLPAQHIAYSYDNKTISLPLDANLVDVELELQVAAQLTVPQMVRVTEQRLDVPFAPVSELLVRYYGSMQNFTRQAAPAAALGGAREIRIP
jgi:hypothetical protein